MQFRCPGEDRVHWNLFLIGPHTYIVLAVPLDNTVSVVCDSARHSTQFIATRNRVFQALSQHPPVVLAVQNESLVVTSSNLGLHGLSKVIPSRVGSSAFNSCHRARFLVARVTRRPFACKYSLQVDRWPSRLISRTHSKNKSFLDVGHIRSLRSHWRRMLA